MHYRMKAEIFSLKTFQNIFRKNKEFLESLYLIKELQFYNELINLDFLRNMKFLINFFDDFKIKYINLD